MHNNKNPFQTSKRLALCVEPAGSGMIHPEAYFDCYREVFEQHHTVMLIIDSLDGRIVHANQAASRFYGWSLLDLVGKNIAEINTLPVEIVQAEMALAKRQQRNFFQFQHRLADGRICEVESRSTPIPWADHIFLCSVVTDVTERNHSEKELRAAKENLEKIVAERTEALTDLNEKLRASNDELRRKNEDIVLMNQSLLNLQKNLEARVETGHLDLTLAYEKLIEQYEDLEKAKLDLQRAAEVQTALREISDAAISAPSLSALYEAVHPIMKTILKANNLYMTIREDVSGDIVRHYSMDEIDMIPKRRPLGKGCTEYVMRVGQTTHITPRMLETLVASGDVEITIENCWDWLGAPLCDSQGACFGAIALFSKDASQSFKGEDCDLLSIMAAQVSLAIQRKRTEEELSESEARYRAVMGQSPEAVLICDPNTGEILETNSRFTERFGYDLDQDGPLTVFELAADEPENIEKYLEKARKEGFLPLQRRLLRHRCGIQVQVERAATLVRYRDSSLLVQTMRDVSEEVRQEREIRLDAELAARVQNVLLKEAEPSEHLDVTTIYETHSYVGGDLYFMDWRYDGSLLRGFLVDAAGHGLTTALHTSAMHVLLREVNEIDGLALPAQMCWLNRRAGQYFDEATFAGVLGFELDLQNRQLRWCCAGMPLVWLANRDMQGSVKCPGMYLGVDVAESFELHTLPLAEGDSVCFMTDGLSGIFERRTEPQPSNYVEMVRLLKEISLSEARYDDATAICIQVKSLPDSPVRQTGWPRIIRFDSYGKYQRNKGEVGKILAEATGKPHSMQEVAVNEAVCNAMECRDGVPRQHQASLKINRVGNRLIVRVKTSRIGFAGNALLHRLRVNPADMFAFGEDAGMGRGIPIMLSTTHRMTYNSEGTEVLLAWKLEP